MVRSSKKISSAFARFNFTVYTVHCLLFWVKVCLLIPRGFVKAHQNFTALVILLKISLKVHILWRRIFYCLETRFNLMNSNLMMWLLSSSWTWLIIALANKSHRTDVCRAASCVWSFWIKHYTQSTTCAGKTQFQSCANLVLSTAIHLVSCSDARFCRRARLSCPVF